jgi:hypothetical protein
MAWVKTAGWGTLVLLAWGTTGCDSFNNEFKDSFGKEFKASCEKSSVEAGAVAGEAKTYCTCMGDGLVKKHDATELTSLSVKLAADPEYTLEVADDLGCTKSLQPVFKASFKHSFMGPCLQGSNGMDEYCNCFSDGLLKRHDARGLVKLSQDFESGKADAVKIAQDMGCLPKEAAVAAPAAVDGAAAP